MKGLKRPLAVTGFSVLFTVLCLILCDYTALVVFVAMASAVCMLLSMIFRFRQSYTLIAICVGAMIASSVFVTAQYRYEKTVSLCGNGVNIEVVIRNAPEFNNENGRYYAVTNLKSINSEKAYGKIRISFSETKDGINPTFIKAGDKISFNADVYVIGESSEAIHNSFKGRNIYLGAYSLRNVHSQAPKIRPLYYYTSMIKEHITYILNSEFGDDVSGLLISMLTGYKDDCPDEVYLNFKRSGTAHIMAVSGLHMSIWISAFLVLFRYIKSFKRLRYVFIMVAVVLVMFIADFSASVCRAAAMSMLFLLGKILSKNTDSLNSLGFALICILCVNPYAVYSISFQLSFMCVWSIVVVALPLSDKVIAFIKQRFSFALVKRPMDYTVRVVIFSLTVSLFTFPICAYHFGYISLISAVGNLMLIFICSPTMVSAGLFIILSEVPLLSALLFFSTKMLSGYMLFVTENLAEIPMSTLTTDSEENIRWLFLAAAILLTALLWRLGKRYYAKITALILCFALAFGTVSFVYSQTGEYKIKLVGSDGSYGAVVLFNGRGVLIGMSDDYYFTDKLAYILESENAELVAFIPDEYTNERAAEYLCADFDIENLLYNGESIVLSGKITVSCTEKGVKLCDNGKTVLIFSSKALQESEECDIILFKDGTLVHGDSMSPITKAENETLTVYIQPGGEITVRGEKSWLNLMKKS